MSSLMEPMIMAFWALLVGGMVIAMYLPIFKLGAAFNRSSGRADETSV